MDTQEYFDYWSKEFNEHSFDVARHDYCLIIVGKGIKGCIYQPTYPHPYGGALLADNAKTYNKDWQCPFRYKLVTNYGNIRRVGWDFLLIQLDILANNPQKAATILGGYNTFFLYEE